MIHSGYQVLDIKVSELPQMNLAYLTAIIEVQGCKFSATVQIANKAGVDPFVDARHRAIAEALSESKKSDFKLFGRSAGGFGKGGGGQWQKKPDENKPATEGQQKRLFAIAYGKGFQRQDVLKTIEHEGWKLESITVNQVNTLIKRIEDKGAKNA